MNKFKILLIVLGVCIGSALGGYAKAGSKEVVLTINGKLQDKEALHFSIKDIEALGMKKIVTSTPWHKGIVEFQGVPLKILANHVRAQGSSAYVVALNNYSMEIPLSDFYEFEPILASRKDGEFMEVADKGPLFIIYPYDSDQDLKTELYHARSVWQVRTITFE